MTVHHAFFLGILQGVTEFLPVSSSGHLVLFERLFDIYINPTDMQGMNVLLHAGTLLALLLIYRKAWTRLLLSPLTKEKKDVSTLLLLLLATIPAGVAGLLLEDSIAEHFQSLRSIGLAFALTGLILLLGALKKTKEKTILQKILHPFSSIKTPLSVRAVLVIGCAQAFALIPGLSRSGLTISTARMLDIERKQALDFSFLMAVPVIAGATVLTLKDIASGGIVLPSMSITVAAVVTSFVSSLLSILFLRQFVVRRELGWFAPYLFVVSIATILLSMS